MQILALLMFLAATLCAAQPVPSKPKPKLWSLQPITHPRVPQVATKSTNPIDAFLSAKYVEQGLKPNGPSDKLTLLRRVSFDLTGLPPSIEEQDAFIADTSTDAYEKLVDRLLASPQHGVRWARHWLDVLRYADLDGLDGSVMPAAPSIHNWRDWMIASLNQDLPFDKFVRAQILGNRNSGHITTSPGGRRSRGAANPQDQFALGFLARGAINGGNSGQQLAFSAVETISTAFMGMTVACAQCHDHRFDPITQADYYSMKALFDPLVLRTVTLASAAEIQANGDALEAYRAQIEPLDDAIEKLTAPFHKKLFDERVAQLPPDVQEIVRKPDNKRTVAEQKIFDDYYPVLRIDDGKLKEVMPKTAIAEFDALNKKRRAFKKPGPLPVNVLVEEDRVKLAQPSYILTSGDPTRPEKDKPVQPGFPFKPTDVDFRDGRREGFVDWLTAKDNPLFARVAVNRIWQWHFGEGIQKSSSDFGMLGGRPSNQPLLDYLASEFIDHGYSMKWLHKLILTSDAYKMSSSPTSAANQEIDPANTYLWHFRLKRLEAEPLWDAILSSAGNLDLTIGGKSFQVVTPDSKQSIFLPADGTFESRKNRRAAYMARGFIPSTEVMSNFLQTFDVDDGRTPCPLRAQTVTAPQALYTMNGELVERASAMLAEKLAKESGGDGKAAVDLAYRKALGRKPTGGELDRALTYLGSEPANLKGLGWLLFNLDEFLFVK
jgi:hypothetical protein